MNRLVASGRTLALAGLVSRTSGFSVTGSLNRTNSPTPEGIGDFGLRAF